MAPGARDHAAQGKAVGTRSAAAVWLDLVPSHRVPYEGIVPEHVDLHLMHKRFNHNELYDYDPDS
jgi:hypothetical protein